MKIESLILLTIFISTTLPADNNWIKIEPINKTKTVKPKTKLDVDLSQIQPINKMMKKVEVLKQLVDLTSKKEKIATNDKNWFIINSENTK